MRNRNEGHVDLSELELVARQHAFSQEANFAVPYLVNEALGHLCRDCLQGIEWVLKDGTSAHHSLAQPMTLSFILGSVNDETGAAEVVAWTQLVFPEMGYPDPGGATSITLGLPVGVRFSNRPEAWRGRGRYCGRANRRRHSQEEELPLG